MPDQRINCACLSPHDQAVCQRVFDQVCRSEGLDPLSREAEAVATMVVEIFANAHTDEQGLLEAVSSRRQKASLSKQRLSISGP
jgi:hypothetical protein